MRLGALGIAAIAIFLALTIARPHTTPGPAMRDFESYYAAGQTWSVHANPYSTDIWQYERRIPGVNPDRAEVLPFIGPPAFLPLWAFFARLPFKIAALLWGAVLLAAAAMFLSLVLSRAGVFSVGAVASGAAILLGFGPFTSDLSLGQAALLSFAACTGAAVMLEQSRIVAAIWVFFAALQPNIALVLFSQAGRRKAVPLFAAAFALFCILGTLFIGFAEVVSYLHNLAAHGDAERFVLIQVTPTAIAYGFGALPVLARITGFIVLAAGIVVWAYAMRKAHLKPMWKLAISCALLPFVAPFFHEHDFVVLLLPAFLCLAFAEERLWSIGAIGTVLVAVDWLGLAQRPDGTLQTALLTLALLCGIFALSDCPPRRLLGPACVLLLIALTGFYGHQHSAPIWPDAMRSAPNLQAPIASIWHDELQATGQLAVQPFWAALRLLTLVGSGLLAWTAIATAIRRDQLEIS